MKTENMTQEEKRKYKLAQKGRYVKEFKKEFEGKITNEKMEKDLQEENKKLNAI